MKTWRPNP